MSDRRLVLIDRAMSELNTLMSQRRKDLCDKPAFRDLSIAQLHALMLLHDRDRQTVTELANLLGISAPSASSIVDRMEEHGYVLRERDTVDRRVVHVQISPEGRDTVEDVIGMRRDQMRKVLEVMTDVELLSAVEFVKSLRLAMERVAERESVGIS